MSGDTRQPRLPQPEADQLYAELIAAMREMDEPTALRFSAVLVLLLLNELGEPERARRAIELAREAVRTP